MRKRVVWGLLCSVAALWIVGCGSDDDTETLNLAGTWRFAATLLSNGCGLPDGAVETFEVTITQSGASFQVQSAEGLEFTGTVSGDTITLTGTLTEVDSDTGCTVTFTYDGEGSGSGTRLTGMLTAEYSQDPATCGVPLTCTLNLSFDLQRL